MATITRLAPPIKIPWLTVKRQAEKRENNNASSLPSEPSTDHNVREETAGRASGGGLELDQCEESDTGTGMGQPLLRTSGDTATCSKDDLNKTERGSGQKSQSVMQLAPRGNNEKMADFPSETATSQQGKKKRRKRKRAALASFAIPEVEYSPLNIKKTIVRPKKQKKKLMS